MTACSLLPASDAADAAEFSCEWQVLPTTEESTQLVSVSSHQNL